MLQIIKQKLRLVIAVMAYMACSFYLNMMMYESAIAQSQANTNLQNPVIFISGLGQSSMANTGLLSYWHTSTNLQYGGEIIASSANVYATKSHQGQQRYDYYTIRLPPNVSIEVQSKVLNLAISFVLSYTKVQKVNLVAYSMGGIVARHYLTTHLSNHCVQALVTIASPHKGSYWANLNYGSRLLLGKLENRIALQMKKNGLANFDNKAIAQLLLEDDDNFLGDLNRRTHPADVRYYSIACYQKLWTMPADLKRRLPELNSGDGVASLVSQDMRNLACFYKSKAHLETAYMANANHFTALKQPERLMKILKKIIAYR